MRTVVISDLHGCYNEVRTALQKVQFSQKRDRLIVLGDLMDRGPQSYECFEFIKGCKETMKDRCIFILGNHEDLAYNAIVENDMELWRYNGCNSTIRSLKLHKGKDWKEYLINTVLSFSVKEGQLYYYDKDLGILFSHAGSIASDYENSKQHDLIWNRDVCNGLTAFKGIQVIGHTPSKYPYYIEAHSLFERGSMPLELEIRKRKKLPESGIFLIDSGCVYGNFLTVICFYSDRTYKVFKQESLQPKSF